MANKNTIRSIRISEQMAELIDQQIGNNFTEKWENLVTRCVWELPKKEEKLRWYQELLERESEKIDNLQNKRIKLEKTISRLQSLIDREINELKNP